MAKNSIGIFLAALRKANGMTQQNVADKLNVSNKAVSRWERDECLPDLSLIPALAEMFGVTCDELLKGERIVSDETSERNETRKTDKQLKSLVNRTTSSFRSSVWIALSVSMAGFICMLGISYGFYRPIIAFFAMLLFEAASFAITAVATNKMRETKTASELFENIDDALLQKFNKNLADHSFASFFTSFSVIVLSLPLVFAASDIYIDSVLSIESYLSLFFFPIILFLAFLFLKVKNPYSSWITGTSHDNDHSDSERTRQMNALQLGSMFVSVICFVIAPNFEYTNATLTTVLQWTGLLFIAISVVCFLVFVLKYKNDRINLLMPGIRNLMLIPSVFAILSSYIVTHQYEGIPFTNVTMIGADQLVIDTQWQIEYIWRSICWALLVSIVFDIIKILLKRDAKKK